jgi:hypothetical protein
MSEQGYLVITDITGYSTYIKDSELEHARDSLAALLSLLIEHTRSPFAIAKLEGDAVFSYAPAGAFLEGQSMLEMMEGVYVAFRRALELMVLNTNCPCNACRNLPNLDLKFFVHFGEYSLQEMGPYKELVGNDVNLLHRLLKNKIKEETGLRAYAAYTQATIDRLQLSQFCQEMHKHREAFADVGEVQLYVQDMHGVWERARENTRIETTAADALLVISHDYPIPQAQMWEYITMPEMRTIFMGAHSQKVKKETTRIADGTVYVCAHGAGTSYHTVLDWRPFEQYTTNETLPFPGITTQSTYRLDPIEGGTRFTIFFGKARGNWVGRIGSDQMMKAFLLPPVKKTMAVLEERIQKDLAEGRLAFLPGTLVPKEQLHNAVAQSLNAG